jgi:hypothetical protein
LNTTGGTSHYSLLPDSGGPTLVRIEKVTEGRTDAGGVVAFGGLHATALHQLPTTLPRRIECIGDSIMCGNHCERFAPFPELCPGQKPVKCTTEPQPCPGHPGVTFCLSDPAPSQCDAPMPHKPCPPCPRKCNVSARSDTIVYSRLLVSHCFQLLCLCNDYWHHVTKTVSVLHQVVLVCRQMHGSLRT